MYQDNKNKILLENKGIYLARKGSKHIHIQYYLTTDCIKKKEFEIMYCSIEEMVAYFFTKQLQSVQFISFVITFWESMQIASQRMYLIALKTSKDIQRIEMKRQTMADE